MPSVIYFDNAATSFPKPPQVAEAMARFLAEDAANPGRAGHRMAVAAERMLDDTRLKLTRFFDGDDHHRLVFALNTTDALNMAIKGTLPLGATPKPHVITTVLEHNSVSRPLVALAQAGQIELTQVDCDAQGFVDPDAIRRAIQPHTVLIAMTHPSHVLGTIQDVAAVGKIAREHDLLFLLDAAQTAGVVPVSIKRMNVDLLAFPGHNSLLGPTGTGG
ncbi:MAG: aminotransferase class V-fold PLP-dependent enzyme, partial [Phycisphaeraceae bacterium]|nr:aminotransferase class V-fold PLP-dependent enzyme [Phycisphaeraceae bacterium]